MSATVEGMQGTHFRMVVEGELDPGLVTGEFTTDGDGNTVVTGATRDQRELLELLKRMLDSGVVLVSVQVGPGD